MKLPTSKVLKVMCFPLAFAATGALALAGSPTARPANPGIYQSRPVHNLPPALQPVFYQSLAKDAGAAYNLNVKGCATLPKEKLTACFNGSGAHFTRAGSLVLHLVGYGRGEALAPVEAVRPVIAANRVSYAHNNLTEWWRVLPIGFEQGFTVAKRPAGHGELTLALTISGKAAQEKGALGWGRLRYGELVVTDAKGKVIPATLKSKDDRVLIAVNDVHAVYPLTVDPLVWIEQKVTASDGAAYDKFGYTVALDGSTALVGAPYHTVNGNSNQGAVYVFSESAGIWTQTAELTSSDGAASDNFGFSVALSGTTALVSAITKTVNGNFAQGAAYVFTEANGAWTQAAELTASDGAAIDQFGYSVALSGTTALLGAPYATVNGNFAQGAAYVFTEANGAWTQATKLTASDSGALGWSVVLDGSTALIGAPGSNNGQGVAYAFTEANGTWTQAAELTASDGVAGDNFGWSVALDGPTALIGTPIVTINGVMFVGAAYVFTEANGAWTQAAKLTASDGTQGDDFGDSVALNGPMALVGAFNANDNGIIQGAAYVFTEANGTWTQAAKLTGNDTTANGLGLSVALDGSTALAGSFASTVEGNAFQGAAYFFGQSDLGLNVSAPQSVNQGQQYTSQTIATNNASAASPAVTATVTVPAAASFVSATATQGSCSEDSGVVSCDFGAINGNAGTATANVTLKATGNVGDTIDNTTSVALATPSLTASAPTTITAGGACPDGYTEYDGSLNPGGVARSPVYQAPGGSENAILTAPEGFELYAVYQSGRFGRHVYRVPGNEVHRWGPKGLYMWLVRARDGQGAYTLCLQHP